MLNEYKIIILGSGPSLTRYTYEEGDTVWCPFSMYDEKIKDYVDLFFGMHDFEIEAMPGIIDQTNYPLDEIIEKFQSSFFTNTISYMIAYAMLKGVKELDIYGVDMFGSKEYIAERSSVLYWTGRFEGIGGKIYFANGITKPAFIYGYQSNKHMKIKIDNLSKWAMQERNKSHDQRQKDQYTGFMLALDMIEKEL